MKVNILALYRKVSLRIVALLFLSIVSFCATSYGMYSLYTDFAGINKVFAITISLLLTLTLQVIMFQSVKNIRQQETIIAFLFNLVIYATCAFFSVGFAYSFWFQAIEAESYAHSRFEAIKQGNLQMIRYIDAGIKNYIATIESLRDYSKEQARIEATQGGTCGYQTKGKPGPRSKLRNDDAQLFNELANSLVDYKKQSDILLKKFERTLAVFDPGNVQRTQDELNQLIGKTNTLLAELSKGISRNTLEDRLREGKGVMTGTSPRNRRPVTFTCYDKVLEVKINAVLNANLPKPDFVKIWNPMNSRNSVDYAFNKLLSVPIKVVSFLSELLPMTQSQLQSHRRDVLNPATPSKALKPIADEKPLPIAFIIGVMNDVFILAVGLITPGRRPSVLDRVVRLLDEPSIALDWERLGFSNPDDLYQSLDKFCIQFTPNGYYMARPYGEYDGDDPLMKLINFFEAIDIIKPRGFRIEKEKMPDWWINEFTLSHTKFKDARYFTLYQFCSDPGQFRKALLLEKYRQAKS